MLEEEKGGLYNQLKNNIPNPNIEYTKEDLISVFNDVFANRPDNRNKIVDLPLEWKHYEWEENGEKFSCWKLMAGNLFTIATTGDGGKEAFDKLFQEELEKWAEDVLKDKDYLKLDLLTPEEPNTMINLGDGNIRFEKLTKEEVVEKYGWLLTEEDKKKLLE